MKYQIVSYDPIVQAAYEEAIDRGESHNMAEIVAFRQMPSLKTDTRFQVGMAIDGSQFNGGKERVGKIYKSMAKNAGISTTGKWYCGQIAQYPGDPKAWVANREDIKQRLKETGDGCDDLGVKVNHQWDKVEARKYGLADDIVAEGANELMSKSPGMKPSEAIAQYYKDHAPSWAKKEGRKPEVA